MKLLEILYYGETFEAEYNTYLIRIDYIIIHVFDSASIFHVIICIIYCMRLSGSIALWLSSSL